MQKIVFNSKIFRLEYFIQTEFEPVRLHHPATFFCNKWSTAQPFRNPLSRYYVSFNEYPSKFLFGILNVIFCSVYLNQKCPIKRIQYYQIYRIQF